MKNEKKDPVCGNRILQENYIVSTTIIKGVNKSAYEC